MAKVENLFCTPFFFFNFQTCSQQPGGADSTDDERQEGSGFKPAGWLEFSSRFSVCVWLWLTSDNYRPAIRTAMRDACVNSFEHTCTFASLSLYPLKNSKDVHAEMLAMLVRTRIIFYHLLQRCRNKQNHQTSKSIVIVWSSVIFISKCYKHCNVLSCQASFVVYNNYQQLLVHLRYVVVIISSC